MTIDDDGRMVAALASAIESVLPGCDTERAAKAALEALKSPSGIETSPHLLTTCGRVLCDLAIHPDSSLSESAARLGSLSSTVAHAMTRLVADGWGVRTRVGLRNSYSFDLARVLEHRDSTLALKALAALALQGVEIPSDSTPGISE